jgi:hypothetical protein
LAATKESDRIRPERSNRPSITTSADLALMERELITVQRDLVGLQGSYGRDMLELVVAASVLNQKFVAF